MRSARDTTGGRGKHLGCAPRGLVAEVYALRRLLTGAHTNLGQLRV